MRHSSAAKIYRRAVSLPKESETLCKVFMWPCGTNICASTLKCTSILSKLTVSNPAHLWWSHEIFHYMIIVEDVQRSSMEVIVLCWSCVYTGLLDNIMIDDGFQFRNIFEELAFLHHISLEKSGVESQNSIDVVKLCHKPLHGTYCKLKVDYLKTQWQLLFELYLKAMNNTLGSEGVLRSAPVFEEFSFLCPVSGTVLPRPSLS